MRLKAKGLAEQEKKSSAGGGDGLTAEEEERVLTNTCSNAGLARGGTNNNPEEFGEEALASPLTRARPLTAGVCVVKQLVKHVSRKRSRRPLTRARPLTAGVCVVKHVSS